MPKGGKREGAGRPPSPKTVPVPLRATPAEVKRWREEAKAEGVSLSALIRFRMNRFFSTIPNPKED